MALGHGLFFFLFLTYFLFLIFGILIVSVKLKLTKNSEMFENVIYFYKNVRKLLI